MNHGFDYLIERKRLKSQLRSWKMGLIITVALVAAYATRNHQGMNLQSGGEQYIAYYSLENVITEGIERDRILQNIEKDENATALVLYINSPGGTVVGSERTYNLLRKISEKKPVVSVMGSMATSGGYMVALATDYIIAHNGTLTGSIGVIFQTAEVTDLAEKAGITFHNFKSSILKAAPNPMEKITPEVEVATMNTVHDIQNFFVDLVVERRNLGRDYVRSLADGRVYTGRQALQNKLVDAIGTTEDAQIWLQDKREVPVDLELVDMNKRNMQSLMDVILSDITNNTKAAINSVIMSFNKGAMYL